MMAAMDKIECVYLGGCLIEVHIVCAFVPLIRPIKTSRIAENPIQGFQWCTRYGFQPKPHRTVKIFTETVRQGIGNFSQKRF